MSDDEGGPQKYLRTAFLERIAHELRGPSSVTRGTLDELAHCVAADDPRIAELMAMARRSVQRVLVIADRLQWAGELEGRAIEWASEKRDLRELVRAAAAAAESLDARRGVSLSIELPQTACNVVGDAQWLTRAVSELVANAIRNARTRANVQLSRVKSETVLTVSDDGPGFSGPPLTRRFAPPTRRQGLGLSLALVHDVAAAHGAQLTFAAEGAGGGARVQLTFPAVAD